MYVYILSMTFFCLYHDHTIVCHSLSKYSLQILRPGRLSLRPYWVKKKTRDDMTKTKDFQ